MAADIDCSGCVGGTNDPDLDMDEKIPVRSCRMALAQPYLLEDPAHSKKSLKNQRNLETVMGLKYFLAEIVSYDETENPIS